jgi:dUTPase
MLEIIIRRRKMVKMIIEKCYPDASIPKRANPTDSGLDVTFHNVKKVYKHVGGNGEQVFETPESIKKLMDGKELELQYLERALIGTGIKATIGPGYEIQVRPRSGLALKQGLSICNTPGTVN